MKKVFKDNNKRDYYISVAMATYNGERYIKEQLDSIIKNLKENDEIVISDDESTDNTLNIINTMNDSRIKLLNGPKNGVIKNFENAVKNCTGKYIFLADQDDVWVNNKVETVLEKFEKEKCEAIVHDACVVNGDMTKIIIPSYFKFRKTKEGRVINIIKPSYLGCCMAFSSQMCKYILPFPNSIEMHDRWIGSVCDMYGKVKFIDESLIKYRRHENNVSKMKRNVIVTIMKNRLILIALLNKLRKNKKISDYKKEEKE